MIFDHYEGVFYYEGPEDTPNKGTATKSGEPISDDHPRCGVCGELMPPGEEMFNYHGYSGPCPKPPIPATSAPNHREWLDEQIRTRMGFGRHFAEDGYKALYIHRQQAEWALEVYLAQQTAAMRAEIERLTAFVSGDGEPDVMAAMWMADRAGLPKGEMRDRFIEEARRMFRLNRTAQSDREAAERERDSLLLLLEQSQKENALLYEELTQLKARIKELMNHLSSSGT